MIRMNARSGLTLLLLLMLVPVGCGGPGTTRSPSPTTADTTAPTGRTAGQPSPHTQPRDPYWGRLARYLGGMLPTEDSLHRNPAYQRHAQAFQRSWARKDSSLLQKLSRLTRTHAAPAVADSLGRVLYPFSGPDFMHVYALFPAAQRYVLFGLEPAGLAALQQRPAPEGLADYLPVLDRSLDDIMVHTFFKTNDMRVDLQNQKLQGTLPVLLSFLARHGCVPLQLRALRVDSSGQVQDLTEARAESPTAAEVTGVEIRFCRGQGPVQVLQYFGLDVSDGVYARQQGFARMLQGLQPTYTYMKSASYLLHAAHFSRIRTQLLAVSRLILQDDTGMPLRYLSGPEWQLQLFGQYERPIALFANRYQPELYRAYHSDSGRASVIPLDFRMGYNYYEQRTNLQLARRHPPRP